MQEFIGFAQENWVLIVLWFSAAGTLWYTETKKAGKTVNTTEATRLMNRENAVVLDIREQKEFANGHISGAKNIPVSVFDSKASELDHDKGRACDCGLQDGHCGRRCRKDIEEARV
jgi:Rhodanese-related sulfurtransferase